MNTSKVVTKRPNSTMISSKSIAAKDIVMNKNLAIKKLFLKNAVEQLARLSDMPKKEEADSLWLSKCSFEKLGKKSDYWKYTDPLLFRQLSQLGYKNFEVASKESFVAKLSSQQKALVAKFSDVSHLVFCNGFFQPQFSNIIEKSFELSYEGTERDVAKEKLSEPLKTTLFVDGNSKENTAEGKSKKIANKLNEANVLALLLAGTCREVVTLKATAEGSKTLHVFFFNTSGSSQTNTIHNAATLNLNLQNNADVTFVEHHVASDGLLAVRLGFNLHPNASLRGVVLQGGETLNENSSRVTPTHGTSNKLENLSSNYRWAHYAQSAESRVDLYYSQMSCKSTLAQTKAVLSGKNSVFNCHGLSVLNFDAILENIVEVQHLSPESYSEQNFKSVGSNNAYTALTSLVHVAKNAQLVSSSQLSKALLLEKNARMKARPQLEIYADDVKCGHGATVGPLSTEDMFYLQSRGIPQKLARQLLTAAFVEDFFLKLLDAFDERSKPEHFKGSNQQFLNILSSIEKNSLRF